MTKLTDSELIEKYKINKDHHIQVGSYGDIYDSFTLEELIRMANLVMVNRKNMED